MKFTLTYETTVEYEPDFDTMQKIAAYAKEHGCDLGEALHTLATTYDGSGIYLDDSTGIISDEWSTLEETYYEGWSDDCWDEEQTSDFVLNFMGDELGMNVSDACEILDIDADDYGMIEEDEDE